MASELPPLVTLDITSISLTFIVLGLYITVLGQVSYTMKEKLYISPAMVSTLIGVVAGPLALNWINPLKWVDGDQERMTELTFQFTRLVIGIQVAFAGIDLPAAYLRKEWLSLLILLLPVMSLAWFVSAGLVMAFVPSLKFVEALVVAACVSPTDPILANAIVKGKYASEHVEPNIRNIISAESGANDGLGYPFLFAAIYWIQKKNASGGRYVEEWIVSVWIYEILLAVVIGALIGYIARKTLKFAHQHKLIDHENFLSYGIGMALVTLGVVGILGSDDVLACFIAGNSLTWRDFYRIENEEEKTQDVIDNLLNTAIFIYIGATMPWSDFGNASFPLSPWKLVLLGITILLVRRLPWVMALYKVTPAIRTWKQALFTGWFGPVGVSAIYYAMLALKDLPEDSTHLREIISPVVYFIALSSIIGHGITVPATKFGPRAFTRTKSSMSRTSTQASRTIQTFRERHLSKLDISSPLRGRSPARTAPSTPVTRTPAMSRQPSVLAMRDLESGTTAVSSGSADNESPSSSIKGGKLGQLDHLKASASSSAVSVARRPQQHNRNASQVGVTFADEQTSAAQPAASAAPKVQFEDIQPAPA